MLSPRIHGTINTPRKPKPERPLSFPWRFAPGDLVTTTEWEGHKARVIDGFLHNGFMPHYLVVVSGGAVWRVPQLRLISVKD